MASRLLLNCTIVPMVRPTRFALVNSGCGGPIQHHPTRIALSDAVSTWRYHAIWIERTFYCGTGVAERRQRLCHVEVVIVERRPADEDATRRHGLRHFAVTSIAAKSLVLVLAVEADHMQSAREPRPADLHNGVVETVLLIDFSANGLEFVGDLAVHLRARQKPNIAAARTPFQKP